MSHRASLKVPPSRRSAAGGYCAHQKARRRHEQAGAQRVRCGRADSRAHGVRVCLLLVGGTCIYTLRSARIFFRRHTTAGQQGRARRNSSLDFASLMTTTTTTKMRTRMRMMVRYHRRFRWLAHDDSKRRRDGTAATCSRNCQQRQRSLLSLDEHDRRHGWRFG